MKPSKFFNKQNIIMASVWVIYEKLKANLDFAKYIPWYSHTYLLGHTESLN